jgi:sulfide:quinone oxidoreductase
MTAARCGVIVGAMPEPHLPSALPDPLRVVIAGGGVAALEALAALRALVPRRVTTTVISGATHFRYRPLLIGEPFGLGRARRYPLQAICADHGAELLVDHVVEVLPDRHEVRTAAGAQVPYDVLVVATGARPYPAFQDGITFDRELSPEDFDEAMADLDEGLAPHVAIVVPDGVSWTLPAYALALLTAAWGRRRSAAECVVTVLTPERAPLEAFGAEVSSSVTDLLDAERVVLRTGVHPDVVTATSLRAGGQWVGADRIISLPLQAGPRLAGLPSDERGFIPADAAGRVPGLADVYVAGDASTAPLKQGGLAAQQADRVAADVARRCGGEPADDGRLVLRGVLDTRYGPRFLRADLDDVEGTSTFSAEPLWWPPTKVASRWLAPYLARVDVETPSAGQPC